MSRQRHTSIPQAHVDNLYKRIAELVIYVEDLEEKYDLAMADKNWYYNELKALEELN